MSQVLKLAILYALFAVVATLANLAAQVVTSILYKGAYELYLVLLVGTVVGLVVKYVLDKRYIFQVSTESLAHDGRLFLLYSLMGVFTTVIFWGTEILFDIVFDAEAMRYVGGALGLAAGYICKYLLDRKYVFQVTP